MKTLITLIIIWGIVSYIRIKKKSEDGKFNLFSASVFDYFGFAIGCCALSLIILILIVKYLP